MNRSVGDRRQNQGTWRLEENPTRVQRGRQYRDRRPASFLGAALAFENDSIVSKRVLVEIYIIIKQKESKSI